MIITRIFAENVLKYGRLDLRDLPAHGVIGVSGLNESGKTSIAETVCFALFGRTVSLPPEEIVKIIRWGENRCTATVEFLARGRAYRVVRHLDGENNQGARLSVLGEDVPLARGTEEVRLAVSRLLGWGFDEFVESFYLSQREAVTVEGHGGAVKSMAGVAALERVAASLQSESEQHTRAIAETTRQIAEVREQIATLGVQDDLLRQLEARRAAILSREAEQAQTVSSLERLTARYEGSLPGVRAAATALTSADAHTSYETWRGHVAQLESSLAEVPDSDLTRSNGGSLTQGLGGLVQDLKQRLSGVEDLRARAGGYRPRLAALLGESGGDRAEMPLPDHLERTRQRRRWTGRGAVITLLLAAAAWTGWLLLTRNPDAQLTGTLLGWLPEPYRPWLLPVAAAATVLLLAFAIATALLGARVRRLLERLDTVRREAELVDQVESTPLPQTVARLQELGEDQIRQAARQFAEGQGASLLDATSLERQRETLRDLVTQYEVGVASARTRASEQIGVAIREIDVERARLAEVDRAIAEERARRKSDQDLRGIVADLERRIADRHHRILVRTKARELLGGACREISRRFNRDVRTFVATTLPLLTQGRYAHLQIDETLTVRVFSSEKGDFMDLDEISAGTQRQIALAVRLGLSERLVQNTHGGFQFVFLDEPFALFDEERTQATLEALPRLSDRIRQVWVTAQWFAKDAAVALHIQTDHKGDTLGLSRA